MVANASCSCSATGGAVSLSSKSTLERGLTIAAELRTVASSLRVRAPEPSMSHDVYSASMEEEGASRPRL